MKFISIEERINSAGPANINPAAAGVGHHQDHSLHKELQRIVEQFSKAQDE